MGKQLETNWLDYSIFQASILTKIFGNGFKHNKNKFELAKSVFLYDSLEDYNKNEEPKSINIDILNTIQNNKLISKVFKNVRKYRYFKKGEDIYFLVGDIQHWIRYEYPKKYYRSIEEKNTLTVTTRDIEEDILDLSIGCKVQLEDEETHTDSFISINILYRLLQSYEEGLFDKIFPNYKEEMGNENYKSDLFDKIFEVEFK